MLYEVNFKRYDQRRVIVQVFSLTLKYEQLQYLLKNKMNVNDLKEI